MSHPFLLNTRKTVPKMFIRSNWIFTLLYEYRRQDHDGTCIVVTYGYCFIRTVKQDIISTETTVTTVWHALKVKTTSRLDLSSIITHCRLYYFTICNNNYEYLTPFIEFYYIIMRYTSNITLQQHTNTILLNTYFTNFNMSDLVYDNRKSCYKI